MTRPAQKFYEQARRMPDTVFEVCERLRNLQPCEQCPAVFHTERHGQCTRGCRLMAEETIAVVLEAAAISEPFEINKIA